MEENKNGTQEQPEQKKKKKSDVILTIALVVAIAVFCYAAYNLYHIYTEYKKGTNEYNSIEEMAVTERDPDRDRKSTRLNSSHDRQSRMPSSA